MYKTSDLSTNGENRILLSTKDLQAVLDCGRVSAIRIGTEAGARIDVGRRVLWNRKIIEAYLEKIAI